MSRARKNDLNQEAIVIVCAVYVGNQIAKVMELGLSSDPYICNINPLTWNYLNLKEKELPEIMSRIRNNFDTVVDSWKL